MPNRQYILPVSSSSSSGGGGTGLFNPSPALTGTPTAPTAAANNNSTQIATTAYADAAQFATVTITSAQFLNMDNTAANAVTIIPAPGAGKQVIMENYSVNLQFHINAYDTGTGNLQFSYSTGVALSNIVANAQGSANLAGGVSSVAFGVNTTLATAPPKPNQAIVANLSTATKYLDGDSIFVIAIRYHTISVA